MELTKEDVVGAIEGVRYRCSDGMEGCMRTSSEEFEWILTALNGAVESMRKKNWPREKINETTCEIKAIEGALAEARG